MEAVYISSREIYGNMELNKASHDVKAKRTFNKEYDKQRAEPMFDHECTDKRDDGSYSHDQACPAADARIPFDIGILEAFKGIL
jgi:hypothetical protein